MLSEKLIAEFTEWAKDAAKRQGQFVTLYGQACVECGGNGWREADIEIFFKTVQKELKPVLVDAGILTSSVFYAYCHAARIALLFDLPFSFADRCRTVHLPEVLKLVVQDKSDQPRLVKFKRALAKVRGGQRKPVVASGGRHILPMPQPDETPERLQYRVAKMLLEYAGDQKVKPLLTDALTQQMVRTAEGLVALYERKAVKESAASPAA
jgi:hypothetical protein